MKFALRILFVVVICCNGAKAQTVLHGTYYLAAVGQKYVAVAIDSREREGFVTNDRYCKIQPLSRKAFFFAAGITSARENNTSLPLFDARDIAQKVYGQFATGPVEVSV